MPNKKFNNVFSMRRVSLLLLFFSFFCAFAEECQDPINTLNNLRVDPELMVGGCVNVISGELILQEVDAYLMTDEPEPIIRAFRSFGSCNGSFQNKWSLNIEGSAWFNENNDNAQIKILGENLSFQVDSCQNGWHSYSVKKDLWKKGMTNTSAGPIGARSNVNNYTLHRKSVGDADIYLHTPSGEVACFCPWANNKYYLVRKKANYGWLYYENNEAKGLIDKVRACSQDGKETDFAKIERERRLNNLGQVYYNKALITTGNSTTEYSFEDGLLRKVHRKHAPDITYKYCRFNRLGELISSVKREGGEKLKVKYWTSEPPCPLKNKPDSNIGKVRKLCRKYADKSSTLVDLFKFRYCTLGKNTTTYVTDANGFLKEYKSFDGRLLEVNEYKNDNSLTPSIYRSKKYFWGAGNKEGHLKGQGICDGQGAYAFYKNLTYDALGNVTCESVFANITGTRQIQVLVDSKGDVSSTPDRLDIHYSYSKDGRNLLLEKCYPSHRKVYRYAADHCKPVAEFCYAKGKVQKRTFYIYNPSLFLVEKITDDGANEDLADWTGVTKRLIERFKPNDTFPYQLVKEQRSCYWDFSSGKEKQLKKVEYSYDQRGLKTEEKVFDAENSYCGSTKYVYNDYGLPVSITSPLGSVVRRHYTSGGLMRTEEGPTYGYYKGMCYTEHGLPTSVTEYVNGQPGLYKRLKYDHKDQLIKETDTHGNCVEYFYDEFGRKRRTKNVSVQIDDSSLCESIEEVDYDLLDRPIFSRTPSGAVTEKVYNVYGQPISVTHPDGRQERYTYSLEGHLLSHVDKEGCLLLQEVDWQGRPTEKRFYNRKGALIGCKRFIYSAFHLLQESDELGNTFFYSYDDAGRLIEKRSEKCVETYAYDSLGRQCYRKLSSGSNAMITETRYDVLGNVLEDKEYAEDGSVYRHVACRYSPEGKKIEEVQFSAAGELCTRYRYDPRGDLIEETNAEGKSTRYLYDYVYANKLSQRQLQITTILPSGRKSVTMKNPQGKISKQQEFDLLGNLLKETQIFYDLSGNKTKITQTALNAEGNMETQVLLRTYNALGQVTEICENAHTDTPTITQICYNEQGLRSLLQLPDGRKVHYLYDNEGHLAEIVASDLSLHYTYTYDLYGRVVLAENKLSGLKTERSYDRWGRLATEHLENGLLLAYHWNGLDQLEKLILPDRSGIRWYYKGSCLSAVERLCVKAEMVYRHEYTEYDACGNLLSAQLPGDLAEVRYSYDALGRRRLCVSDFFQESIEEYDLEGNPVSIKGKDGIGEFSAEYLYDGLNQIIQESGVATHSYGYDNFHNRYEKDGEKSTVNACNQVTSFKEQGYTYDANGSLVYVKAPNATHSFTYDALGRLTAYQSDQTQARYCYDAFGRRVSKTVNGTIERYLYLEENEIGSYDCLGNPLSLRLLGKGVGAEIGASVAIEVGSCIYIPFHDSAGNIRSLVDLKSGQTVETIRYNAFGEEEDPSKADSSFSSRYSPWTFSSKRYDPESGLVFFGKRYYLPALGRWISKDPKKEVDGLNLYAFVHNNPLHYFDLWGEKKFSYYWKPLRPYLLGIGIMTLLILSSTDGGTFQDPKKINWYEKKGPPTIDNWNGEQGCSKRGTYYETDNKDVAIAHVNGMRNAFGDNTGACEHIKNASNGDVSVHTVYNKSHGFLWDLFECAANFLGFQTDPCFRLREQIVDYFSENPNGRYLLVAHSQGCIITRNVLRYLPQELRERISVIAVAPGAYIDETLCKNVVHLVSQRDFVPHLDPLGRSIAAKQGTLKILKPLSGKLLDHCFTSETYEDAIRTTIDKFKKGKF
jgi:RHS repeat-associated protein